MKEELLELIPQLRTGKITRGMIGVTVGVMALNPPYGRMLAR